MVLLALLQLLLQLSELKADHLQVALVERLQLVHNEGHVTDLGKNKKNKCKCVILIKKKSMLIKSY